MAHKNPLTGSAFILLQQKPSTKHCIESFDAYFDENSVLICSPLQILLDQTFSMHLKGLTKFHIPGLTTN